MFAQWSRRRPAAVFFASLFLASLALAGAEAPQAQASHSVYPHDLPDFSHPDEPHSPRHSVAGGQSRRLLVIYVGFDDLPIEPSMDAAWLRNRIFGFTGDTARNYLDTISFGNMQLNPAAESQGLANDGIVVVNAGAIAAWRGMTDVAQHRRILELADPWVDYASFDTNGDEIVSSLELAVLYTRPWGGFLPEGRRNPCGGTRNPENGARLDEMNVNDLWSAGVANVENLITVLHELGHVMWDLEDYYGYGIGNASLAGPTCGGGELFFGMTAYDRMHLGWDHPRVVTEDGYYLVPALSPIRPNSAFLLYDPDRGTGDYFIVENRRQAGFDRNIQDKGLYIWRIADRFLRDSGARAAAAGSAHPDTFPPIELMRPDGTRLPPACAAGGCYSGSNSDAWDADDSATASFRTMNRNWLGGDPAGVAVRAIGPAEDLMRVYFDVRGPGVLVDPWDLEGAELVTGEAFAFSLPVMNTDDAGTPSRSFTFSVEAPAGWTTNGAVLPLAGQEERTASLLVTPSTNAAVGPHRLRVIGTSTDGLVSSSAEFTVMVSAVPKEPDGFEPTTKFSPIPLEWESHTHYDPRVLADYALLGSSEERWELSISGLNLHDASDHDGFSLVLPDRGDPAESGHTALDALPECTTLTRRQFDGQDQDVVVASQMSVRIRVPGRNAPDEGIRLYGDGSNLATPLRVEGSLTKVLPCPDTREQVFSFGERPTRRINYPDYAVEVAYTQTFTRIPVAADWLLGQQAAGSVGSAPCAGFGSFPYCIGEQFLLLELVHPFVPERRCEADGCPDHLPIWWHGGSFEMAWQAPHLGLEVSLLNELGETIAGSTRLPAVDPPRDEVPFGAFLADLPTTAAQLQVDDLPPGFYVLRVVGPAMPFLISMETPEPPPDGDGDGLADLFDNCPTVGNGGQADLDSDGLGDACDAENTLTVIVNPDEDMERKPIRLTRRGIVPVAVLSTPAFDAGHLDLATLCFGPMAAPDTGDCSESHATLHVEDVNLDGLADAMLHFEVLATGLTSTDTSACLVGKLLDGTPVIGCDAVRVM